MKNTNQKIERDPSPEQPTSAGAGEQQGKTNGTPAKTSGTNGRPPAESADTAVPFFESLAAINPVDWDNGRFRLYIYRLLPKIESTVDRHYIGRVQSGLDESDILATYGSGKYYLRLNDTHERKTVSSYTFACYDPEHPPKIDRAQLLDVPENGPYRNWIQRASTHAKGSDAAQQSGTEGNAVSEIASLARNILEQNAKKQEDEPAGVSGTVTELLLGMAKGRDELAKELVQQKNAAPGLDPVQALAQAVALVKQLTPAAAASPGPDFIAKRMEALETSNRELLSRLLDKLSEKPPAPPTPPETEFQKTLMGRIMEKALDMLDGGGPSRTGGEKWWETALHHPEVHKLGHSLGQAALNFSQAFLMSRGGRPGQAANRQPPTAAEMLEGMAPSPETQPPVNPTAPSEDVTIQTLSAFFTIEKFRSMMFHLNTGLPGQEFAIWCSNGGMSLADHATIKAIGRDKVMETIRSTPIAWQVIRPIEQQFAKFLDEFLSWTPEWIPDEGPGA